MASGPLVVSNIDPPVELHRSIVLPPVRERWAGTWKGYFREVGIPLGADYHMVNLWKAHKEAFLERGYAMKSHDGKWFLQQWLMLHQENGTRYYKLSPTGQEILESFRNPQLSLLAEEKPIPAVDFKPLPKWLEDKLLDYQREPARQLLRALLNGEREWGYPGAWDGSDMGTGKTYTSFAAAIATGREVCVVCPLAVIPAWQKAARHFGVSLKFVMNYDRLRTGNHHWLQIEEYVPDPREPKTLGRRFKWALDPAKVILLFDEAHSGKNEGTRIYNMMVAAVRNKLMHLMLSGTMGSTPLHMRATGRCVGLHHGKKDWDRFLAQHGCFRKSRKSKNWKFSLGVRGRKALQTIHHRVFPARGCRIRIEDLGDRFPETQIIAEAFETGKTKEIALAFNAAMIRLSQLEKQGERNSTVIQGIRQSIYMKAWHDSELLKIPTIISMIDAEKEAGRSVAVFVNFSDVRIALMEHYKTQCGIFGGNENVREAHIQDFQAGRKREIFCNVKAGGIGVSLHDETGQHPRTSIILPSNHAIAIKQAFGRVHRALGKSKSRQILLFAAGTVEERICAGIRRHLTNISTLNDGDLYPEIEF